MKWSGQDGGVDTAHARILDNFLEAYDITTTSPETEGLCIAPCTSPRRRSCTTTEGSRAVGGTTTGNLRHRLRLHPHRGRMTSPTKAEAEAEADTTTAPAG